MNDKETVSDLAGKPVPFLLLWGIPILVMLALNLLRPALEVATMVIAGCFVWMGVGCAVNARRCHRRHCYYASPVLLTGAVLTVLVGFGILDLGPMGLNYVTWGTFAAVLLTFVPEGIFGKYKR